MKLMQVIYLRRFPVLQSLCIRGNPLCDSEDYQYLLTAFLPNLIYIDYKRCDRSLRAQAYEKYQLRIDELNAQEQAERESERRSEELEAKKQLHQRAFVSDLDSDTIFQALYENDPEGRALLPVPEFSHTIETFSEALTKECRGVFRLGLEELEKRQMELDSFWECVNREKKVNGDRSVEQINGFKSYQLEALKELGTLTDPISVESHVKEYMNRVHQLWYALMKNEMILVEELDELMSEFKLNMADMVNSFIERTEEHFAQCRQLQAQFSDRLMDLYPTVLERFLRPEVDVVAPEETRTIFMDKDSVINAIQASNDAHLVQIDSWADRVSQKARAWFSELMDRLVEQEGYERNRARVMEINQLTDSFREEIEKIDLVTTGEV
ncbi:unnamed protein product [Dicrocoelium dendriticum]|nr:unnamed protein product [Dicrocoelium dendriticum]